MSSPKPLNYAAALLSIEKGDEQNLATFYLMNTSPNRNRWAVTDKALEDALAALLGKPLGLGEGYREGHFVDTVDVGKFIAVDKPNGYALGRAHITDPVAWENLATGAWGPISVVISSYGETCSLCGEDLTGQANPFEHEHIAQGDAHILVNSFKFDRVDFVPDPAYPQAGMINFGAEQPVTEIPLQLCAAYYEGSHSNGGGAGAVESPAEKKERTAMEEKIERLQNELSTFKGTVEELEGKLTAALTDLKAATDKMADYDTLKAQVKAQADKRHADLVEKVAAMRYKAKLCDDQAAEAERLKEKSEEYLAEMLVDAAGIAAGLADAPPSSPLTHYTPEAGTGLTDALTAMKAEMIGVHSYAAEAE